MTKYEWFEKFEAELGAILGDEKERAKEYYEELFADKQEQGVSEEEIINEFGSPETAAKKILEESASNAEYADDDQKFVYKPVIAQNEQNGGDEKASNCGNCGTNNSC